MPIRLTPNSNAPTCTVPNSARHAAIAQVTPTSIVRMLCQSGRRLRNTAKISTIVPIIAARPIVEVSAIAVAAPARA